MRESFAPRIDELKDAKFSFDGTTIQITTSRASYGLPAKTSEITGVPTFEPNEDDLRGFAISNFEKWYLISLVDKVNPPVEKIEHTCELCDKMVTSLYSLGESKVCSVCFCQNADEPDQIEDPNREDKASHDIF